MRQQDVAVCRANPVIHPENLCLTRLVFIAIFIVSIKVAEVASVGRGFPMLHRRDCLRLYGHFLPYGNVKIFAFNVSVIFSKITILNLNRACRAKVPLLTSNTKCMTI
jgi:hypothetical protein